MPCPEMHAEGAAHSDKPSAAEKTAGAKGGDRQAGPGEACLGEPVPAEGAARSDEPSAAE